MKLGDEYEKFLIFIALLIAGDEGWAVNRRCFSQKKASRGVLRKRYFENMQQIYRRRQSWAMKLIAFARTKLKGTIVNTDFEALWEITEPVNCNKVFGLTDT